MNFEKAEVHVRASLREGVDLRLKVAANCGRQIFEAALLISDYLLANKTRFLAALFFSSDLTDLEEILRDVDFPGDVVSGYLTRAADEAADENIAAVFQQSGFNPIATYRRMITYRLPRQRPNLALEYATVADVDQIHEALFQTFNKYTDHLPTKNRLHSYIVNQWVIVNPRADREILDGVSTGRSRNKFAEQKKFACHES